MAAPAEVVVVNDMDNSKRITMVYQYHTQIIFVKVCPVIITPQTIPLAMICLLVGHNKETCIKKI
jgi:hypothetical protein